MFLSLLLWSFAPTVDRLGSRDFREREAASQSLRSAGWLAVPSLLRGSQSLDPEIAHRSARLLKRYPTRADLRTLWLCFRPDGWVAGCEVAELVPCEADACLRKWGLYATVGEPWPHGYTNWSEPEQLRAVLNFARMRAVNPSLAWSAVPWSACLEPEK